MTTLKSTFRDILTPMQYSKLDSVAENDKRIDQAVDQLIAAVLEQILEMLPENKTIDHKYSADMLRYPTGYNQALADIRSKAKDLLSD